MALVKINDFFPNYSETVGDNDIKKYDVYSDGGEKIGSISNVLVDETDGRFRYFIIDMGFWVFGKKVLLPVGRTRIDDADRRIYALGLTKEQVENLPEFSDDLKIDESYEERVRGIYRPTTTTGSTTYDRATYTNNQDPYMYGMDEPDRESLRLYQTRLQEAKSRNR